MSSRPLDVLVVGGGLAGAATAAVLGREGRRVALVDPRAECPPVFKAEKIEPDQAALLRSLCLFDAVLPHVRPIETVTEAHWGMRLRTRSLEQYGTLYQNLVNSVRRQIPETIAQPLASVVGVDATGDVQTVKLSDGQQLTARLVVVASGTGERFRKALGLEPRMVRAGHSLCSGFDIQPTDGAFSFDSITYWADRTAERVDYATFFPVPGSTRVNLFSYRDARDPWVRELAADPITTLRRAMPRLMRATGPWRVTSKVETRPIDLYTTTEAARDGIVLIGDAFQSVCPATGTGLSKVLTDVQRLCRGHVPGWLETPGMGAEKIAAFYRDPEKTSSDRRSLQMAEFRRRVGTDRSLKGWARRQRDFARVALASLRDSRQRDEPTA